jgi:hypothetical protein
MGGTAAAGPGQEAPDGARREVGGLRARAGGEPQQRRPPGSGSPAAGATTAGSARRGDSGMDHATSSLLRTQQLMRAEVERMGALGGQLDEDASAIGRTAAMHDEIGSDVEEARSRIKRIQVRGAARGGGSGAAGSCSYAGAAGARAPAQLRRLLRRRWRRACRVRAGAAKALPRGRCMLPAARN